MESSAPYEFSDSTTVIHRAAVSRGIGHLDEIYAQRIVMARCRQHVIVTLREDTTTPDLTEALG
jgi:hypothetical protein